jgi:umuD protein. serine peptidase. MEROPS family S24
MKSLTPPVISAVPSSSPTPLAQVAYISSAPGEPPYLPLMLTRVAAGFPSPADDYVEQMLDLNEYCVGNAPATFYLRVEPDGDSMINAGIFPGDVLCVDRSLHAQSGDIIIAALDGGFTVKELGFVNGAPLLISHNVAYKAQPVSADSDFEIVGVVTAVIRKLRRGKTSHVRPD